MLIKSQFYCEEWTWYDILAQSSDDIKAVTQKFDIHPIYQQDLLQADHLPKFEAPTLKKTDIFILLRYMKELTPLGLLESTGRIAIFYSDNRLITIHDDDPNPLIEYVTQKYTDDGSTSNIAFDDKNGAQDIYQMQIVGPKFPEKSAEPDLTLVLCKLVKEAIKTMEPLLYKLEDEADFYENRITVRGKLPMVYDGLFKLKRKLSIIKKLINLNRPIYFGIKEHSKVDNPAVQDLGDAFTRIETLADEIIEKTTNLINLNIALSANKSNEVMKTLTIFSAFFLPLTFIVGIYGMNFHSMPELAHPYGYFAVWVVMIFISVAIYGWFKHKRWL